LTECDATAALDGITRVLEGLIPEFHLEYRCAIEQKELWFELRVHPLCRREGGALITHFDISRCRRAEQLAAKQQEELQQINKHIVLSDFTAAWVHELAQPLAAIRLNTQAAKQLLSNGRADHLPISDVLSDIMADSQRSAKLLQQLRTFLMKRPSRFKPVAVNQLIRRVAVLLREFALRRKVSISLQLGTALPLVWGERVQLQQVLVNLMINAFNSMRRSQIQGREVVITTHKTEAGQVAILVQDRGPDIPTGQLQRVFEPLLTTKPPGLVTGLAVCRLIVEAHRGEISVANDSEEGVIIRVLLPGCPPGPI